MLRRLRFAVVALILTIVALSTGADFLFFLLYLGLLVVGGSYVLTRFGLSDLEAGYWLDRTHASVGEMLRATYTVRNTSRLPKPWLEIHNPSTLAVPLPGRALILRPHGERSWVARVPLTRRGHFRIDPMILRTGDPFGFFEATATVGAGAGLTIYPRVEALPRWRLPAGILEGTQSSPERTLQTTPLVTSIRAYAPGDAYNRIHWKQSARQQELQVKEFDLEQTADAWIFLDLQHGVHAGVGDESTVEAGVRVAAAIASRALAENRAVGLTATVRRLTLLQADRGGRQYQKIMQLLAAVQPDGTMPLQEAIVQGLSRLRRGMVVVIVTPSLERDWVRPLAALRSRGVGGVVCLLDALAYDDYASSLAGTVPVSDQERAARTGAMRAVRHALSEYGIVSHLIVPERPLGELLVTAGVSARAARV